MDWLLCKLIEWQPLWLFLSAVGAVAVAIIAVFQDRLRAWVFSPRLNLEPGPFYPDFIPVPVLAKESGVVLAEACYLQIPVKNKLATAEKVEVFIARIEKEINGSFHKIEKFYPMNLKWRHFDTIFLDRLSPRTSRDCTLGRIADPNNRQRVGDDHPSLKLPSGISPFRLELAVPPSTRSDLLEPGKYRIYLEIGASNSRRLKRKIIELEFTGKWLDDPKDMAAARVI